MSDLNRNLAPIPEEAWEFIEEEAKEVLDIKLFGRKAVDFVGPKGLQYAALNTGRRVELDSSADGVDYSQREVLPLVELEVPFSLELAEIEALVRGAEDVESDPVREAATKVAQAENEAIFYGLEEAEIQGIAEVAEHSLTDVESDLVTSVVNGVKSLAGDGVEGPYNLLLGTKLYSLLYNLDDQGYTIEKRLQDIIKGKVRIVPTLGDQGLLLPTRGEDFELIVGRDLSIGFDQRVEDELQFFFTQSFTFRVNSPEAAVVLE